MKKQILLIVILLFNGILLYSQVVNNFEKKSSIQSGMLYFSVIDKEISVLKLTNTQRNGLPLVPGPVIYNSSSKRFEYSNGTSWVLLNSSRGKQPVITTTNVSNITSTKATSGGTITADNNSKVTTRGICWSTHPTPTTADFVTTDGVGAGSYTSQMYGLMGNVTYYVRAYATINKTISYGNEISFNTPPFKILLTYDADFVVATLKIVDYAGGGSVEWQESTDGSNWATIPGAVNDPYQFTPTKTQYYRAMVTVSSVSKPTDMVMVEYKEPPSPDGAPSALTAVLTAENNINLSWTIGSTNQEGHRIYMSTDGVNFTEKARVIGTTATYTVTGLTINTSYSFKVTAYLGEKESSASNTVLIEYKEPPVPDGSPSSLTAVLTPENNINLSWTIGSINQEGHRIYMSTDGTNFTEKGTVSGTTSSYLTTGLAVDTKYYFKVTAYIGTKESNASNTASASTFSMFVTKWNTANVGSAVNTIVIPTNGTGYDCTVFWGDGKNNTYSGTAPIISHVYDAPGIYTVKIAGKFPRIYFANGGDKLKLIEIAAWGSIVWSNMGMAFYGCNNLTCTATDIANTAAVDDMSYTFSGCYLFNGDISKWNTSNVTGTQYMLNACRSFNQPIGYWDMSKCRNMSNMFKNAWEFNQPIGSWNVSSVANFGGMFSEAYSFDQDISTWNIQSATSFTSLSGMFSSSLSTTNYDKLLVAWSQLNVASNLTLAIGITRYSASSSTARAGLTGKGWTISDGGVLSESKFNNGKLILTWDDGYGEQYTNAFPIIKEKQVKSTHYIISSWVGTSNRITWAQLQEMHAAGMDIQCHTKDHAILTNLTQQQVIDNLTAANNAFIANYLPAPQHLAYPMGSYNDNVKSWVSGLRLTGRDDEWNDAYGIRPNSDKYALPAYIIDNLSDVNFIIAKNRIAKCADAKTAIVLCAHSINSTGDSYSVKISHLEQYIDLAKSLGMDIITMSELYPLMDQ